MARIRSGPALAALGAAATVLIGASLFVGDAWLTPGEVWAALTGGGDATNARIVLDLRLPRAILAFAVGVALAGSGAAFQGLFRNPLADPFVTGVSGGAALGAVAAIVAGVQATTVWGLGGTAVAAFAGAIATVFVVYQMSRVGGRVPVTTLLLAGFAMGTLASALVSVLLLYHSKNWNEILLWLLGSLDRADAWTRVGVLAPFTLAMLGVIAFRSRELNLLLLGEEQAQQLGAEVERVKRELLVAGSIAAAATVALCGIIGFVGLIVPHAARTLVGPDHRRLVPAAVLAGGTFLLAADLAARAAFWPGGLPVGTVTALAGVPFFLALLRRNRAARRSRNVTRA